jgi:hypothetical protein
MVLMKVLDLFLEFIDRHVQRLHDRIENTLGYPVVVEHHRTVFSLQNPVSCKRQNELLKATRHTFAAVAQGSKLSWKL